MPFDPHQPVSAPPDDAEQHTRNVHEGVRSVIGVALRLGVCVLVAALLGFPLALAHGLERTQVQDTIGVVPATLQLTGDGESQLRLGILGNLYSPASKGMIGISATVNGPPSAAQDRASVASYFSPQMLEVYGALFHDPAKAIRGYTDALTHDLERRVALAWAGYAVVGGAALYLGWLVLHPAVKRRLTERRIAAVAVILPLALVATCGVAWLQFRHWANSAATPDPVYALPTLDGSRAQGTVTDSVVLRLAIEGAIPKVEKLIDRQETRTSDYVSTASAALRTQESQMTGPREGEVAILAQSDMHCNAAMINLQKQVVTALDKRYGEGTVGLMVIAGDLTTNGTAAEGGCIKDEAAISAGAPVAAITGNHETELSADQMAGAGMHVLEDKTVDLDGTTVLGIGDPSRTEMFGATRLRGDATEQSVGEEAFRTATEDSPDIVLLHEGYAVQSFLGSNVAEMTNFLDARGSATVPWDDGIRDLPTGAIFYGHWHRSIEPRVVWNSDGSWTLVMELNTSGGAIASPTLNHFSTPWSQPQQQASFPVLFKDTDTGLFTGYQIYSFGTGAQVTVEPRVDLGIPGGQRAAVVEGAGGHRRLPSHAATRGAPD